MLTRKQHELLMFIHDRLQQAGIPPSFDEMKDALELKSKSGIHRLITALEERGFIRRLPNRARALEVIKLPESYAASKASPVAAGTSVGSAKQVSAPGSRLKTSSSVPVGANDDNPDYASVPMMGRIAAGVPISAIQDHTHSIAVSPDMLGSGEHFALKVEGDSMVNVGILNGDIVVIRKTSTALPGEIVVALVDDEEATLKTFRRNGAMIGLEPANDAYETKTVSADRVNVQGKLVGLIRSYH